MKACFQFTSMSPLVLPVFLFSRPKNFFFWAEKNNRFHKNIHKNHLSFLPILLKVVPLHAFSNEVLQKIVF